MPRVSLEPGHERKEALAPNADGKRLSYFFGGGGAGGGDGGGGGGGSGRGSGGSGDCLIGISSLPRVKPIPS